MLEDIYSKYYEMLVLYAYKFIGDIEISKDLVQDVFLIILKKHDLKDITNVKSFIFRSVRNSCFNYLHHKEVKNTYESYEIKRRKDEIEYYDGHLSIVETDIYEKLLFEIENLPDIYRTPLKLSRLENKSHIEISNKLDIPVRTVETRIYRALNMLRKKINKNDFDSILLFVLLKHL